MIITPRIAARIVIVGIVCILLQLSFFSEIRLFGTSPDILATVAVTFGLLGGSMAGAVAGFSIGLLVDCMLVSTLGVSSLVLLSAGYLAGLYRERYETVSLPVALSLCFGLTLLAQFGFAAIQLSLGVDAPISILLLRDILLKSILAFFLAAPLYAGIRRFLAPGLVDGVAARGRRAPLGASETGG